MNMILSVIHWTAFGASYSTHYNQTCSGSFNVNILYHIYNAL